MISSTPTARPVVAARPRPVPWSRLAWVTQRQRRGAVIGVSIVLGVFAVYLVIMAIVQNNAYAAVQACHPAATVKCQALNNAFYRDYWGGGGRVIQSGGAQTVSSLMFALPVPLGAFAGAPLLAREFESGTFRFAWTQGAGRTRWAVSTLVLPAAALTAAAGAFTALFYWYFRPFIADGQVSSMLPLAFHQLADAARLHAVAVGPAGLAVLAVPAHRGRLAARGVSGAHRGHRVDRPAARCLGPH
jgi:hypothetical protein